MAYGQQYAQNSWSQANEQSGRGNAGQHGQNRNYLQANQPQVGATFTPGGTDDYYIPEVISPAPQRVMPEVPSNIQDNLAHLELEASDQRRSSASVVSPHGSSQVGGDWARAEGVISPPGSHDYRGVASGQFGLGDQPSFSPFPKLHNPPQNVPQSDEDKEATLERARLPVLNSNDPEMQLAWAQDALAYVEISMQHETRISENQPARPQTPQTEHQLRVDAINVTTFLAEQNHPKAVFMKGMWLEFGKFGFRMDKKEAFRCYSRAAERRYGRAEYRIGMQYESSSELPKAISHYNAGVALGDSASHYRLGMMTLLGQHGQRQDYARGVELIRYSAETADENAPQGAYVYGMLLARELPNINIPDAYLPLDILTARVYIEKAAYLGFAKAQVKMGSAYELCLLGCEFDPALSLHYNALAARQGEADADMAISKWFLCGYDGVFEKSDELAFTYAQRAAQTGLPTAEFAMGYFYEIGMYVQADVGEARRWYEKAASSGNNDAIGRIESISRSKTLSREDHENVAISRIKSQYGSKRGARPDRFKAAAPPMPSIPDDRLDMPDPSSPYSPPPVIARPSSAAPYPLEDGPLLPQQRPGTSMGVMNPTLRPSSAFGINPNLQPSHGVPASYRGSTGPSPARPNSSVGLGGDWAPQGAGGRGGRLVSSASAPSDYLSAVGAGRGAPSGGRPLAESGKPQPPRLDIGFSAPHDPLLDKQRRALRKPSSPAVGSRPPTEAPRPQSAAVPGGHLGGVRPPVDNHRPQSLASPSGYGGGSISPRPPRSRPASPGTNHGRHDGAPHVPAKGPAVQKPAAPKPSGPSGAGPPRPAATAARPPGKGPKTFEEMGVPQASKEGECVMM